MAMWDWWCSARWCHCRNYRPPFRRSATSRFVHRRAAQRREPQLRTGIVSSSISFAISLENAIRRKGLQAVWRKHRPKSVTKAGLVFHGLRKSAVVTLLEAGCTTAMVQAITGQSIQMVEHYARGVNQAKLADAAILAWEAADRR
jgi:integrase